MIRPVERDPSQGLTTRQALQAALAGEHAALYLYGVLAAQTSERGEPDLYVALSGAYGAHRRRRDDLSTLVVRVGGTPVAAEVAYRLPRPARTPQETRDAALLLEDRISRVYAQLVGSTSGSDRRFAVRALEEAAVRRLDFRGSPEMFPGLETMESSSPPAESG